MRHISDAAIYGTVERCNRADKGVIIPVNSRKVISRFLALALGLAGAAIASAPPRAIDIGELKAQAARTPISVTVALALPSLSEAESLMRALNTPGDAQYHRFLSAGEFEARFAPSGARVAQAVAGLARYGLAAERTTATTLRVTGLPADMERAFAVNLHRYEVAAHDGAAGYTFHAPLGRPRVPAELAGLVAGVVGLDSHPSLHPHLASAPRMLVRRSRDAGAATTGNPFGQLTVADFASQYDVQPLYDRGVLGSGRTVGILTFANFTPSDAFAYWSAVGLAVNQNRITVVPVDGGAGAPSDASGSDETTLDVEQSGGVAPQAHILVYHAPNSSQALVDIFAQAVSDNTADSLSMSWGQWEWFDNTGNSPVIDPATGRTVGVTQAVHELLVRAAIQGQSVFTSAGDGGAYEVNHDLGCFGPYSPQMATSCTLTLSVDYPASDPAITAAGGTTLPGVQEYCLTTACTPPYYPVAIAHEQAWGWDYLEGLCAAEGTPDPVACGIFGTGGGGGVSVMFAQPEYQRDVAGVQSSQRHQLFRAGSSYVQADGIEPFYFLPPLFQGRNIPDVSLNADPETGYSIYYTSDVNGFKVLTYIGGTSFVAPQLNGIAALLGQYNEGRRVGLLNAAFYLLAQGGHGFPRLGPALQPIAYGDNWFYSGGDAYSPAAGLGTLDVAVFARVLMRGLD